MTSQTINLNLIPGSIEPVINVSQYDKGQTWNFNIYSGSQPFTIPTGSSITIQGTKPDKTGFQYGCTFSGNVVTAIEQQQMTILSGKVPAEIVITKNDELIGSLNFNIMVEKAALADDTAISETDLPLIEEAVEALSHIDETLETMKGYKEDSEAYANGKRNGSDVGSSDPAYHNNSKYYAGQASSSASSASGSATSAGTNALISEGYAVGEQNGSAVGSGSPYYQNNAEYYKGQAANSATNAGNSAAAASGSATTASNKALVAEGYADGKQNGTDVASGSPYYHNNSKYYSEQAAASAQSAAQSAASFTVDSALSTSSTNPVQNKVITTDLNNVKQALSNEVATRAELGAHNLFDLKTSSPIVVTSGVTFVTNTNKTITANGQSTASSGSTSRINTLDFILKAGSYIFSAGLPATGSDTTYYCFLYDLTNSRRIATVYADEDVAFTVNSDITVNVFVVVYRGYTANNIVYKPMIRDARDKDPTFAPFSKTNVELTQGLSEVQDLVLDQGGITTKSFSPVIAVNDALPVNAVDVSAKIEPIQAGSGTPSPSNVRAISGRDSVKVTRAGKNLIPNGTDTNNGYADNRYIDANGAIGTSENFYISEYFLVKAGGEYTLSDALKTTNAGAICFYTANKTFISGVSVNQTVKHITVPSNAVYARCTQWKSGNIVQFEAGNTATECVPFVASEDYTIQLGDTYYGGTLDVTSGMLTVDMGISTIPTITEFQTIGTTGNKYMYYPINDMYLKDGSTPLNDCICEKLSYIPTINGQVGYYHLSRRFYVGVTDDYTVEEFNSEIAGSKVVYPLDNPFTVQLTPQEIQMFQGNNTIFTDSGDTSIQYYANGVKNLETVVAKMQTEADGAMHNQMENGCVNLLENKATSQVINGITWIVNADKTITANGRAMSGDTPTASVIEINTTAKFAGDGKKYRLSGCPSGGSANSYFLSVVNHTSDFGEGAEITFGSTARSIRCCIAAGVTVSNLTFKPMITLADVPNSDYAHYVPYCKSNRELTEEYIGESISNISSILGTNISTTSYNSLIERKNGVVYMNLNLTTSVALSSGDVVLTLPTGFRPKGTIRAISYNNVRYAINSNGNVYSTGDSTPANSPIIINIAYPV